MGYYEDICDRLIEVAKRITIGRGFFTEYFIGIEEEDGKRSRKISSQKVDPVFFDEISKAARKLRELLNEKETKELEQSFGIKGKRDEALMNLYKHYNRLTALDDIDYTTLESMHVLIDSIEKLEHARQIEASDEIAKMSLEKLEKFARPMPEIKMDVKQFEEIVKDHCGKKGAKE